MGLNAPREDLVGAYLSEVGLLGLAAEFRTNLMCQPLPTFDPRAWAIASVQVLMSAAGLGNAVTTMVGRYLSERNHEQLAEDIVFLENASILGVPEEESSLLMDVNTLAVVSTDARQPPVTLQVWYIGHFLNVATQIVGNSSDEHPPH